MDDLIIWTDFLTLVFCVVEIALLSQSELNWRVNSKSQTKCAAIDFILRAERVCEFGDFLVISILSNLSAFSLFRNLGGQVIECDKIIKKTKVLKATAILNPFLNFPIH